MSPTDSPAQEATMPSSTASPKTSTSGAGRHDGPSRGQTLPRNDHEPTGTASTPSSPTGILKQLLNKKDNFALSQPNGGVVAWLQVVGCFLVFMNNWGLACSFGVYQAYYQLPTSNPSLINHSASAISWIGTLQASLTLIVGVLSGPLFDKGYFFPILVGGSMLMFFAFMMLSLCDAYWQILLCQGLLQGICAGLLYIPSIAQIPQYFTTKRGTALGLVTAGGPFGGIIYPILFRELVTRYDFAVATRVLGGVVLATLAVAWVLIKPLNLANKVEKKKRDPSMFKDPYYLSFCGASFLLFCGLLTPYILSATYSFTVVDGFEAADLTSLAGASAASTPGSEELMGSIASARDTAFYTVAIINTGNFFGRIIPAALSDRGVGPEFMVLGCTIVLTILGFSWIAIKERAGYNAFLILYGFGSGGVASLPGVLLPYLCPALDVFATRLGFVYFCAGLGVLIGTPIATAIDRMMSEQSAYMGSQLWVGVTMAVAIPCVTFAELGVRKARLARLTAAGESSKVVDDGEKGSSSSADGESSR